MKDYEEDTFRPRIAVNKDNSRFAYFFPFFFFLFVAVEDCKTTGFSCIGVASELLPGVSFFIGGLHKGMRRLEDSIGQEV